MAQADTHPAQSTPGVLHRPLTAARQQRTWAVAALGITGVLVGFKWLQMLFTPAEWIAGEGWHVYEVKAVLDGYPLYADPTAVPHVILNYTPLFILAQVPLAVVFGAQVWIGRLLVIASVLGCGWIVYHAARAHGSSRPFAALGCSLFLFNPITIGWGAMARVDYPSLIFGLLALHQLDRSHVGRGRAVWIAALVAVSVFTKQSAFVQLVPVVMLALLIRARASVVCCVLALAAFTGLGVAVSLAVGSGWTWFWWHVASGNVVSYAVSELITKWRLFVLVSPGLLLLGLGGMRGRLDHWTGFTLLALLSALAVVVVNGGMNYFMPATAGLAVLAPRAMQRVRRQPLAGLQLGIGLASALALVSADAGYRAQVMAEDQAVRAALQGVSGPTIVDYALAVDPRADSYVFIYEYAQRVKGGKLGGDFLVDRLAAREIQAAVLDPANPLPGPAAEVLARDYVATGAAGSFSIYRPLGR